MHIVVAVDENWGIGYENKLLASVPADMKNFRAITTGKTVILGRKTLETFPGGKPLKNRRNIILSTNPDYVVEGAEIAHSVEEVKAIVKDTAEDEVCVIGGASVYKLLLPLCHKATITKFHKAFPADTYFPNLDEDASWEVESEGEMQEHEGMEFQFVEYRRK